MKIGFLLVNENSPYAGAVRPFINWANYLSSFGKDFEGYILLLRCGNKIERYLEKLKKVRFFSTEDLDELINFIKGFGIELIISDDLITRLKHLVKIRKILGIKTGVYVQILFGVHAITEVFHVEYLGTIEKFLYKSSRYLPFSTIKKLYVNLLQNSDVIIANSFSTANLLQILYGVEQDAVVYPPVDTNVFKPHHIYQKNGVLIYLGSKAGDTDPFLVKTALEILKTKKLDINVIGNTKLASMFMKMYKFKYLHDIDDEELAKVYSSVLFTICPQKWETFGYVAAESIACGTPVIAFNVMGLGEIIGITKYGIAIENTRQYIETLLNIDKKIDLFSTVPYPKELSYSIDRSSNDLLKAIMV